MPWRQSQIHYGLMIGLIFLAGVIRAGSVASTTNITIGLIGIYCSIPGLRLNGSLITNYNETYDPKVIDINGMAGFTFFSEIGAVQAIEEINNSDTILPGIHVNIKRFTDCGPYYKSANTAFVGRPAGFPLAVMSPDIIEKHTDVIGVIAGEISSTARGSAQMLSKSQIPYCSWYSGSPRLDDRTMFNYFFRMFASASLGQSTYIVLKKLSVRQVGLIYQKDSDLPMLAAQNVISVLQAKGILITANVPLKTSLSPVNLDYAASSFRRSNIRYILGIGSQDWLSRIVYGLGKRGLVGSQYLWLLSNPPISSHGDPLIVFGPDFFSYIAGMVTFRAPLGTTAQYSSKSITVLKKLNQRFGFLPNDTKIYDVGNTQRAYDCVNVMLLGLDKFLKQGYKPEDIASRSLQAQMNFTRFKSFEEYECLAAPSAKELTDTGNLKATYEAATFTGQGYSLVGIGISDLDLTTFKFYSETSSGCFVNGTNQGCFNGSSTWPSDGMRDTKQFRIQPSDLSGRVIISAIVIGLIFSLMASLFVILFRKTPSVKAASPPETLMIATGCSLGYLSLSLTLVDVNTVSCRIKTWFIVMGFAFVTIALIFKNRVLTNIFGFARRKKQTELENVVWKERYRGILCIFVEVILLLIWTTKISFTVTDVMDFRSNLEFFSCQSDANNWSTALLLVFNGCLIVLLCHTIYALKVVKVEQYNESAALAVITVTILVITALIFILASSSTPDPYFYPKQDICIWLMSTLVLILVIGPKVLEAWLDSTTSFIIPSIRTSQVHSGLQKNYGQSNHSNKRSSMIQNSPLIARSNVVVKPLSSELVAFAYRYHQGQKSFLGFKYWTPWNRGRVEFNFLKDRAWLAFVSIDAVVCFRVVDGMTEFETKGNRVSFTTTGLPYRVVIEFGTEGAVAEFVTNLKNSLQTQV